jgi:hypothetical protein
MSETSTPQTNTRTPLKNGTDWIVLKPEITFGEDLDLTDASRGSARAFTPRVICAWVESWSFSAPLTPEGVVSLSLRQGREVDTLVATHMKRLNDEFAAEGAEAVEQGEVPAAA